MVKVNISMNDILRYVIRNNTVRTISVGQYQIESKIHIWNNMHTARETIILPIFVPIQS